MRVFEFTGTSTAVIVWSLLAGCGSSNTPEFDIRRVDAADVAADIARDTPRMDVPDVQSARDVVVPPVDNGSPIDVGGACAPTCTGHGDCASSCPSVSTGTWCCQSGTCVFDSNPVCGSTPDVITPPGDGTGSG